MDMGAYFLPSLCGPKNANYWDFRLQMLLRWCYIVAEQGIEDRRRRLITIDAIEPNSKEFHDSELYTPGALKRNMVLGNMSFSKNATVVNILWLDPDA